jgi:hypothetical protein
MMDALGVSGLISSIQQELFSALGNLDKAFDDFMKHTGIEEVLGRINDVLAEVTQIANMINFCNKPITPIAIPNVLENAMQSFLGKGKELIDKIGTMIPDEIGTCLDFSGRINNKLIKSGILYEIDRNWDKIINNDFDPITDDPTGPTRFTINDLRKIIDDINVVTNDIRTLVANENRVVGTVDLGGSAFDDDQPPRIVNTQLGVLHNPDSVGIQGNTRIASTLKYTFDKLAGYPVIDSQGKVYDNVFQLFLDEDMINLLRNPTQPRSPIVQQQPVYNYCGDIIGYTPVVVQQDEQQSLGQEPETIPQPGFKANGLPTGAAALAQTILEQSQQEEIVDLDETITYMGVANTKNENATEVSFPNTTLNVPIGKSWFYTVTALGRKTNGSGTMAIRREGVAYNDTGSVVIANGEDSRVIFNNTVSSQWRLEINDDTGVFRILVFGEENTNILWKIKLSIIEV